MSRSTTIVASRRLVSQRNCISWWLRNLRRRGVTGIHQRNIRYGIGVGWRNSFAASRLNPLEGLISGSLELVEYRCWRSKIWRCIEPVRKVTMEELLWHLNGFIAYLKCYFTWKRMWTAHYFWFNCIIVLHHKSTYRTILFQWVVANVLSLKA